MCTVSLQFQALLCAALLPDFPYYLLSGIVVQGIYAQSEHSGLCEVVGVSHCKGITGLCTHQAVANVKGAGWHGYVLGL